MRLQPDGSLTDCPSQGVGGIAASLPGASMYTADPSLVTWCQSIRTNSSDSETRLGRFWDDEGSISDLKISRASKRRS